MFDDKILIILVMTVIFGSILGFFYYQQQINEIKKDLVVPQTPVSITAPVSTRSLTVERPVAPPTDLVKNFDYRVLSDPLKEPLRRPPRHVIGPIASSPIFNYPTRGWPDNFSLFGYLVDEKAPNQDPHKVLNLYGREKFPNSVEYQYFVGFMTGDTERKYQLDKYKRELYDGDEVVVDLFGNKKYRVKLFSNSGWEYNPLII